MSFALAFQIIGVLTVLACGFVGAVKLIDRVIDRYLVFVGHRRAFVEFFIETRLKPNVKREPKA